MNWRKEKEEAAKAIEQAAIAAEAQAALGFAGTGDVTAVASLATSVTGTPQVAASGLPGTAGTALPAPTSALGLGDSAPQPQPPSVIVSAPPATVVV